MNPNHILSSLEAKWREYLKERGHHIYKAKSDVGVVRSRNSNKVRYRWLLLIGERSIRKLSISEQAYIHRHLIEAKQHKEAAYLVVGFTREPRRIVVLPAGAVLKAGRVRSDKGGIDWDD